jgi:hypothetical protein
VLHLLIQRKILERRSSCRCADWSSDFTIERLHISHGELGAIGEQPLHKVERHVLAVRNVRLRQ